MCPSVDSTSDKKEKKKKEKAEKMNASLSLLRPFESQSLSNSISCVFVAKKKKFFVQVYLFGGLKMP